VANADRLLGVTLDGYAVEGGYDAGDGPSTSFGVAQVLGRIAPSLRSPGTFEHLEELAGAAAGLGFAELRLTVEWARLEPRPDVRSDDAMDTYERAIARASREGLAVTVVLCDQAWPSWVGQEPWLAPWSADRFARHARWAGERLGATVGSFVTFRAPNSVAVDGWVRGTRPPFRRKAGADAVSAMDGMLRAHAAACHALAEVAPHAERAILLEVRPRYEDEGLWRDLLGGVADPVLLAARRDRFEQLAPRGARPDREGLLASGAREVSGMLPSLSQVRSAPTASCWLAGSDDGLLAASLEHAQGTVDTVELGTGGTPWARLLDEDPTAVDSLPPVARRVHLHGLVGSTGPLSTPVGLLDVDHRNGSWSLAAAPRGVERALRPRGQTPDQ
jgi:hypothetical protein